MANILIEQDTMTNIANAIRTKNGLSTTYTPAQMVNAINDLSTSGSTSGSGSVSDAVRFIDYDGTILHTYSAAEFAALTAMPANPTHTGLVSQGWNWSLADAKAQVTAMGGCDIGQMYITDDGKTRVYISLVDSARLSPYLGICPNGTVVVDWGDNTATDTLTGDVLTTVKRVQHTYASTGDYVITLEVTSGEFAILGSNTSYNGSYLLNRTDTDVNSQRCYLNAIQKVELGANVIIDRNYAFYYCMSLTSITIPSSVTGIGHNAFYYCHSLTSITIPSNATSIGSYAFQYCYSLASVSIPRSITSISSSVFYYCYSLPSVKIPYNVTFIASQAFSYCNSLASIIIPSGVTSIESYTFDQCNSLASITIPSGVTSIGGAAFQGCNSLASLTIPSGVTSIGTYAFSVCRSLASITIPSGVTAIGTQTFQNCFSLASLTIPSGVTSIAANAFSYCSGIAEYHFLPTTPPTLANTNAFNNILADCKIYVPSASLSSYKTATNWSTYASYMIGE